MLRAQYIIDTYAYVRWKRDLHEARFVRFPTNSGEGWEIGVVEAGGAG